MAKPLNLDDYEEVAPAGPKPLDLAQFEEVDDADPAVTRRHEWASDATIDPANQGRSLGAGVSVPGNDGAGGGTGRSEELAATSQAPPERFPEHGLDEAEPAWLKTLDQWKADAASGDPEVAARARRALEEIATTSSDVRGRLGEPSRRQAAEDVVATLPKPAGDLEGALAEAKAAGAAKTHNPILNAGLAIGRRLSDLPEQAAVAPFEAASDPHGAMIAPAKGMASALTLGGSDAATQLKAARDELAKLEAIKRPQNEQAAAAIDRLTEAARRKVAEREAMMAGDDKHALLQAAGAVGVSAVTPEGLVAQGLTKVPAVAALAPVARTAIAAGGAGAVGGGGRAAVARQSPGEIADATLHGLGVGAGGGALVHGAAAAGGKLSEGAARRVEARETDAILRGVPANLQTKSLDKLGGKAGLRKVVADEGLKPAMKIGAPELAEATAVVRGEVGDKLSQVYRGVDKAGPGADPAKLEAALNKVKEAWRREGDHQAVTAIEAEISGNKSIYGDLPLSAENLHGIVRRLGTRGYGSDVLKVSRGMELARDMHEAVKDVLHEYVDEVAKANPGVVGREQLQDLNRRYSNLKAVQDLADSKTKRLERVAPTMGEHVQNVVNKGAAAAGLLGATYTAMNGGGWKALLPIAAAGAVKAAPTAAALADRAIVWLAIGARNHAVTPELITSALQAGASREQIKAVLDRAGIRDVALPEEPVEGDRPIAAY